MLLEWFAITQLGFIHDFQFGRGHSSLTLTPSARFGTPHMPPLRFPLFFNRCSEITYSHSKLQQLKFILVVKILGRMEK